MDLTTKFADFFRSPHKTLKEYDQALNESALISTWSEAVTLWRAGIKKVKENDLSGLEDLKKANEALKTVVAKTSKEEIEKQAQQLNESVLTFDTKNLEEEAAALEYQLGALYDKLKEAGMPEIELDAEEGDEEFADDELLGEKIPDADPVAALAEPVAEPAAQPVAPAPVAAPTAVPATPAPVAEVAAPVVPAATPATTAAPVPAAQPVAAPVVESKPKPKSGYEAGFNAGRARWNKGENAKSLARSIAEGELREESYAFVNRYMEGFAAGFAFEEEVKRDLDPALFEEEKEEPKK